MSFVAEVRPGLRQLVGLVRKMRVADHQPPAGAAVNSQGRKPLEQAWKNPKPCRGDTTGERQFGMFRPSRAALDSDWTRGLRPWLFAAAPSGAKTGSGR